MELADRRRNAHWPIDIGLVATVPRTNLLSADKRVFTVLLLCTNRKQGFECANQFLKKGV
jgi:hypothetical protein